MNRRRCLTNPNNDQGRHARSKPFPRDLNISRTGCLAPLPSLLHRHLRVRRGARYVNVPVQRSGRARRCAQLRYLAPSGGVTNSGSPGSEGGRRRPSSVVAALHVSTNATALLGRRWAAEGGPEGGVNPTLRFSGWCDGSICAYLRYLRFLRAMVRCLCVLCAFAVLLCDVLPRRAEIHFAILPT